MKRTTYTALLLALTVVVSATAVMGTVGGMVSTQTQTERNTITSCTTITESGTYVLGSNITANRNGCIRIEASDVVLDGNGHTIDGNGEQYERVVVASATGGLSNVTVRNLNVKDVDDDAIRYVGVTGGSVTNVSVSVAQNGVVLRSSSDVSVTQNSFTEIDLTGIAAIGSNDNRIAQNTFAETKYGTYGIELIDSTGNTITENTATALEGGLLESTNASRTVVTDNTVTESGALSLDGDNNRVANNTLTGLASIGVSGSNNTVLNNSILGGLSVDGTSNTVVRNEIDGDRFDPFGLSISGSGHRIVENTISGGGQDSDEGAGVSTSGGNHTLVRNEIGGASGIIVQTAVEETTIRNNRISYFKHGVHIKNPELCGNMGAEAVEIHRNTLDGRSDAYYSPDTVYGVLNEDDGVVNATRNYWGDTSGPSSPENANGTLEDPETGAPANGSGDAVSEGSEPGVSNVHFYPYLSAPPQDENENENTTA